jgi:hypothetical protein
LTAPSAHPYYLQNRAQLLAANRKIAETGRPFTTERYGESFADNLIRASLVECETLIPELPYIGDKKNRHTRSVIGTSYGLAQYRALKAHGKPV